MTTKYVPIETIKYEKEYVNQYHRDSIFVKDSVLIYSKNDTVFLNKYEYIYRNIFVKDTVSIIKVDSIPYPVEIIKDKIIYKTKWYEDIAIWGFFILLFGGIIMGLFKWIKSLIPRI
jgi:hypothetical protein